MADLQGTKVISQIVPPTTEDTFPTHDSIYGKGGWREVDTIEERNSISRKRMRKGMIVFVAETDIAYILKTLGQTQDEDVWKEYNTDISSIKQQIKIPITKEQLEILFDYGGEEYPSVKLIAEIDGVVGEFDVDVSYINNRTLKANWEIGVNGCIIIN